MPDTPKLRGVGIGAGYFAPFQYEAWTRIPEVEIVALYNRTEERARPLMAQFGVARYYDDWKAMLDRERPDFVDIITPPETHEEMCAFAAARGITSSVRSRWRQATTRAGASSRTVSARVCASWCTRTSAGSPGIARSSTCRHAATSASSRTFIS